MTGLPLLAEPLDGADVATLSGYVDAFLVGARSMRNSRLLSAVGHAGLPVVLKRSFAATYKEWLGAAEYVRQTGNNDVILCERGIRSFVQETRNTLDISAVPVMAGMTELPVIVDPSQASGNREWVLPLSLAAAASGSAGLLVESHINPDSSWADAKQSVSNEALAHLIRAARDVAAASRLHRRTAPNPSGQPI